MSTSTRVPFPSLAPVLLVLAAGCGGGREATSARPRLAVVPKGTAHDFWHSVHVGVEAAADAQQVDVDWIGPQPEGDREAQIRLVETSVGRKVAGIALAPVDSRALAGVVDEARRAGVPTVVFDSSLDGDAHVSFVATDNRRGGELAGEALGALLGGKGKVAVLRYQEGSASTMEREAGCLAALRTKFPDVLVVSDSQHGPSLERARIAADALLLAHADLDGVFTPNESTTHAMLSALEAAGRGGKVKFVGFDASPPLVAGLASGSLHALVVQDPVAMGRQAVELLARHLRGEAVPRLVHTDVVVATPQNRSEPRIAALLSPASVR